MKKIALVLMVAAVAMGCRTAPAPEPEPERRVPADETTARFEILQHKGSVLGVDTPEWVIRSLEGSAALEAMPEYEGQYVIVAEQTGGNLTAVQRWVTNFNANAEFSQRVSTRVEQYFTGALAGDLDDVAAYLEEVVTSISEAQFSGRSTAGDWWIHIRWFDEQGNIDREEYRAIVLMTIDRDVLDEQIANAVDDARAEEELDDNEQRVRDLVQSGRFM
ncbi:hypothetical protein [Spirochaeta africana]|uniref:Lipoprotein n=1 Tax=Spirochaeta africana (strain ATCC 700263 / DSM 8902 / Z-7692) TaxID=889378 RepID=H9UMM3_SPIAZ|nr:hypothetical protein [Spirochaeta africana]AFG38766.1 hypothetical protein Spiaf_2742 [Spirochaeta africana DSM 8902]